MVTHPCGPLDSLTLIDMVDAEFGQLPGVPQRAAALRAELQAEWDALQARPPTPRKVLYLIWREPWMTVARDTYISRLLAAAGWHTLPDLQGGDSGAARYPLVERRRALADGGAAGACCPANPTASARSTVALAQALCPNAQVRCVDGELLSWYGARTAAGLRYARTLADSLTGEPAGKHQ